MCVCLIFRASSGANQDISIDDKRISSPLCKQNNRVCFRLQIYLRCKSAQVWRSKRDAAKQSALVVAVVAVVVIVARSPCHGLRVKAKAKLAQTSNEPQDLTRDQNYCGRHCLPQQSSCASLIGSFIKLESPRL